MTEDSQSLGRSSDRESTNLDVLRSVAVGLVFFDHLLTFFGKTKTGTFTAYEMGHLGVLLFFLHTSLVLMWSLERQENNHPGKGLFLPFLLRRCFRIYPLSIAAVTITYLLQLPLGAVLPHKFLLHPVSVTGFLANLLLIQNLVPSLDVLGPLWSLPLEMQMYFLLPTIFLFVQRHSSIRSTLLLWFLFLCLGFLQRRTMGVARLDVIGYGPNFLAGVVAYKLSGSMTRISSIFWPLCLFGGIALFGIFQYREGEAGWFVCLALGVALALTRDIRFPPVVLVSHNIAKYSYGIYLSHLAAIWIAFVACAEAPLPLQLLALIIFLVGIPVGMYYLIEAPMINLGRRLSKVGNYSRFRQVDDDGTQERPA